MMSDDRDWRLRLDLDEPADLDRLRDRVRDPRLERDARAALSDHVVLTHDGNTFFAYAVSERALNDAREAIEAVLHSDQRKGRIVVSHWEESLHAWLQVDPPLAAAQEDQLRRASTAGARRRSGARNGKPETRAVMCVVGKLIRKSFERQMLAFAQSIDLQCAIVEHPHLLSSQVAFEVTGPHDTVDQFDRYLKNEARATVRLDPGLIPYGLP
jgi:hypothetical protein